MSDYMPNPGDPKRHAPYDFSPGSGKRTAYLLAALLVALMVGFLFIGSPASDRGGEIAAPPNQMSPSPQR